MPRWSDNPWLEKKIQASVDFKNQMESLTSGESGGASLDDLKQTVNGDDFFRGRLPSMVHDVRNGDYFYLNQNWATDSDMGRVRNMISQYTSLLNDGHTNAEIMSHLYGGDGSDYASWDTDPPNKTSHGEYVNPEDDPDGMTPTGPNQHYNGGNDGGNNTNAGSVAWNGAGIGQSGGAWGSGATPPAQEAQRGMLTGARMAAPGGMGQQMQGRPPQAQEKEKPQGYGLFSPDNEQMRSFISKNLKNRLFG